MGKREDESHIIEQTSTGFRCTECSKVWGSGTPERDKARTHENDTATWGGLA
jgi:hypothetical protein